MASGTGMLVNGAETTSYDTSFCPGGTSRFLILSTEYSLFLMWRSDLPTRGAIMSANTLDALHVRLTRLATIGRRGTFALWILGRPYILGISSDVG